MSCMDNQTLFTKVSPTRLFLTAALPGSVSMLASAAYDICEGLFVGRFLGEIAFAGVNLAMPFVIINYALADLLGVGSSVPIAIALGRGDEDEANNIFSCTVVMIVVVGVVTGCLLFFGAPLLFALMGATGRLSEQAVIFLQVNAVCSPITTIMYAVDNYLRICGRIRRSTCVNLLMSVLGILLILLFLRVFHLGVGGAALAFCLATFIAVGVAFLPLIRGELQLRFVPPHFSQALVWRVVADGTSSFLSNVSSQLTSIVLNSCLLALGGAEAVSIFGVLMYLENIVRALTYGMLDALQPAVGYNWGRRDVHRVKQIELRCFAAAAIISVIVAVTMNLIPVALIRLFLTDATGAFLAEAVLALRIVSLGFLARWMVMSVQAMLVALSQPRLSSLLSICTSMVFPLMLIVALQPLGLTGLWLNNPCSTLLAAALGAFLLVYFRRELRQGKVRVGR